LVVLSLIKLVFVHCMHSSAVYCLYRTSATHSVAYYKHKIDKSKQKKERNPNKISSDHYPNSFKIVSKHNFWV